MGKYLVTRTSKGTTELQNDVFDTLEEANDFAEKSWNTLTKSEREKAFIMVGFVDGTRDYLSDDAFGEDGTIDYAAWHSIGYEPDGFDSRWLNGKKTNDTKEISLNGGVSFQSAEEAIDEILERGIWNVVVEYMDDQTRELIHRDYACENEAEFLKHYLDNARFDLIVY